MSLAFSDLGISALHATKNQPTSIGYPSLVSSGLSTFSNDSQQLLNEKDEGRHEDNYPKAWALATLLIGLSIAIFLVSLDRTIVTTAIPYISNEFHSPQDVGWYGSAYLLTSSALQPSCGRIYAMSSIKWTYLVSMAIFEVGSIVCATSSSSKVFIVGRAITGVGSAGILSGSFVAIAHGVPLAKRPLYTAIVGTFFSIGAVVGPLIGGVFTSLVTWRWCFWINLPLGAVTIIAMLFFFKPKKMVETSKGSALQKLRRIDYVGSILLVGSLVMFFLALELVNSGVPWDNSKIIGLLAGTGAGSAVFACWSLWLGDDALIPPSIAFHRSVAFACITAFFLYATLLVQNYFLPIWFQAIQSKTALISGVDMIPYLVATAIATIVAGVLVSKLGYFAPPSIAGCAIATIGSGLLVTLHVNEPTSNWIGYFILTGAGLGFAVQQGFIAVQTALSMKDVAIGTAAVSFSQALGGAVFVSVGNTIVLEQLTKVDIPGIDVRTVIASGVTMFDELVPAASRPAFIEAYNSALQKVFISAVGLCGVAFVASCGLPMLSVKQKPREPPAERAEVEAEAVVRY